MQDFRECELIAKQGKRSHGSRFNLYILPEYSYQFYEFQYHNTVMPAVFSR